MTTKTATADWRTSNRERMSQSDRIAVIDLMRRNKRSWQRLTAKELAEELTVYNYPVKSYVALDLRRTLGWPKVTKPARPHRTTPEKAIVKTIEMKKLELQETLDDLRTQVGKIEELLMTL